MKKIVAFVVLLAGFVISAMAAEVKPAYPGGTEAMNKYISENLQYPEMAKDNGIEGVVDVTFVVKTDGSIGNIKIKRMIDPDLESEAIRLVKGMPKWTPASDNGAPVESTAEISVPFTLE